MENCGKDRYMKKEKRFRQWAVYPLIAVMLLLQGCTDSSVSAPQGEDGTAGQEPGSTAASDDSHTEQTMGRYLEEEITLPEEVSLSSTPKIFLQKLENGDLLLAEQTAGIYISSDNGESWSPKEAPWFRELSGAYLVHLAIAPNGAIAVAYNPPSDETNETEESIFDPVALYADPDGNTAALESPDGENYIHRFSFDDDSRLYACTMGGGVWQMDPEGETADLLFETEGLSDYICFTGQYLADSTSRGILLYDMENRIMAEEDKVLQDFITENVGDIGSYSDAYSFIMAPGDQENVIYFACSSGLFRHVIGGSAVEQIIEGTLSSLSDPMMMLAGMAVLPDNEFAILYTNGHLYRYVYHPDIPAVPDEQVTIYSLNENYAVRQAVSLFQKQHPEVYAHYEIGLSEGNGMTSEDAIKNLNTRIMSGSGPDLLVLDGLPMRSYQERGVLMDLTKLVEGLNGEDEPFPNIVEACREDGKLWYLPLRFRLPFLMGDKDVIQNVTDLTSFADMVEQLRAENPQGALTALTTEEKTLRTLGINCSAAWTDPKTGAIDTEKLTDFLRQARRIYQAEISGIGEEELTSRKEHYENMMNYDWAMEYYATTYSAAIDVAMKNQRIGTGVSDMVDGDFNVASTLAGQEENFGYCTWQGQIQNGFIPKGMISICSTSGENELAQTFFRFLYGRSLQDIDMPTGFPMNMASFEQLKENPRGEDENMSIGTSNEDGAYFSLEIKWCTEDDFNALKRMAESASGVCAGDPVVEEIVYDIGQKALNGSAGIEDTVSEITRKAAIYLAE